MWGVGFRVASSWWRPKFRGPGLMALVEGLGFRARTANLVLKEEHCTLAYGRGGEGEYGRLNLSHFDAHPTNLDLGSGFVLGFRVHLVVDAATEELRV